MDIIDIKDRLPFVRSNGQRPLKKITSAIVHHSAIVNDENNDPVSRFESFAESHINKEWNHISYHYGIDYHGKIYKLLEDEEIAWHAGNYPVNKASLGIVIDGDFTKQRLTAGQVGALWSLLTWLCTERPDMPKLVHKTIKGHNEVKLFGYTACPSKQVSSIIKSFKTLN